MSKTGKKYFCLSSGFILMPTLNEHSSEETAATEGIFNVHMRGAH